MTADPSRVAQALRRTATILDDDGQLMLDRTDAWVPADPPPSSARPEPGDDSIDQALSDSREGTPAATDWLDARQAATYHRELVSLLSRLAADTARLAELHRIIKPQEPNMSGGDDGCWSCARTHSTAGIPRWEPVHRTVSLNGRLRPARPLCRPCGDFARRTGRVPTTVEVEAFHRASPKRWPKEHAA
jgi:hypothetical protein